MDNEKSKIIIRDHTGARHDLPAYDSIRALSEAIRIVDQARAAQSQVRESRGAGSQTLSSTINGGGKERG